MKLHRIGEHTRPRVLVAAPRRNDLELLLLFDFAGGFNNLRFPEKVRDGGDAIARTRGRCAPRINRCIIAQ